MSEKRRVPTFRITLSNGREWEGPVVSPDRLEVAESLPGLHEIFQRHQAVLIYAGEWRYLPWHSLGHAARGRRWFLLPWPLNDDPPQDGGTTPGSTPPGGQ